MIQYGLVSVSFRNLSCEEIISLVKESGLTGIEWGGDVHIPPGDFEKAEKIAELMNRNGLKTTAYGSYYRAGTYGENYAVEFSKILDTAIILEAPIIRIWAGVKSSSCTDASERKLIADECAEISALAEEKNITISFECHRNTLTDDIKSTVALMNETEKGNLCMFWQPNEEKSFEYNLDALKTVMPYLTNVHVFNWPQPGVKKSLSFGTNQWKEYLSVINNDGRNHWCSLEFMPDDNPDSLKREAEILKNIAKK